MNALGCRVVGVKRREGRPPEGVEGLYTLEKLEKYTVDVLGNYTKINREKRVPFDMKRG